MVSYDRIHEKSVLDKPLISLSEQDNEVTTLLEQEYQRQRTTLNLIASENYASPAVLQANASVLTNKYAEGYPGKRYYAGCSVIDQVEQLAIDRCKALFKAPHANVQPNAGSPANFAAYAALLKPGDTIMGMQLAHGGHLTHGHAVNISGQIYKSVSYGVDATTEMLDYNAIEAIARQHKPALIIAGASAYSRIIDFERFAAIARSVNAYLMVDIAHIAGLIAAGLHPSPVGLADVVTSTTHKTLRGPRGGIILAAPAHSTHIDRAVMPGTQGGPFMHTIAAKAVAFGQALQPSFIDYQKNVIKNVQKLAHSLQNKGYRIVSGQTDNHLFIIDLRDHNITGHQAQQALEMAGICVSKSCIPNDPAQPWVTSGIRLGSPALTTRGFTSNDMETIACLIDTIIKNTHNETVITRVKHEVADWCTQYPLFKTT